MILFYLNFSYFQHILVFRVILSQTLELKKLIRKYIKKFNFAIPSNI